MPPIYLPKTKSIKEIFEKIEPYSRDGGSARWRNREHGFSGPVYCNVRDGNALLVTPTRAVLDIVADAQSVVDDENMYFSAVIRDDNTVLILAQYNKIIGSRWLCILPASEIVPFLSL